MAAASSENSEIFYFYGRHELLPKPTRKGSKKKSGYRYRCYQTDGENLKFFSHNFQTGYLGNIFLTDEAAPSDYTLRMRASFPISGKVDVWNEKKNQMIGIVTRGRKIYDASENLIGKFIDPRSWKEHFGESMVDFVGELVFGGGDSGHGGSDGANAFILSKNKVPLGKLVREQLPFFPDPPRKTEPGRTGKMLKKILPKNIGSAIFDITPPTGWKLELVKDISGTDRMLILLGTLMTVDIRRW